MPDMTPRKLLESIQAQYTTFAEVQEAIREAFNTHVLEFPPGYTYLDVVNRGVDNGWIRRREGKFIITVEPSGEASASHPAYA